jgi:hypothetical protein
MRRLVERNKRTGHDGALPFKLSLAQLATTFVEYANEIGRDPPSVQTSHSGRTPASIIRRIETASPDFSSDTDTTLDNGEIDLMIRAISQNQDASPVCLGCQQPGGHKLEDCNRFVDYIVAKGLAQQHPQLKVQIANSHWHVRRTRKAGQAHTHRQTQIQQTDRIRTDRRRQNRQMQSDQTDADRSQTRQQHQVETDKRRHRRNDHRTTKITIRSRRRRRPTNRR